MALIKQFVQAYEREYDFYATAGRLAQQQLEGKLRANGIRAIVTSRAKRPDRLEPKLRKRAEKRAYATLEEIRDDAADLAGVRVALYFPGQRDRVNQLVLALFTPLQTAKTFPEGTLAPFVTTEGVPYEKTFSGYRATHHRVRLNESTLVDDDRRFAAARIEIQVASVLMHAWAEVEHDLVYKPLSGALSTSEHYILDELNGLVLTGELSLERLERAMDQRIQAAKAPFDNPYDLSSYLFDHVRNEFDKEASQEAMGHADWLLELLRRAGLNSAEAIKPYLDALAPDFEKRTIAEQVIDKIVSGSTERYQLLDEIRLGEAPAPTPGEQGHRALGFFINRWVALETCLTRVTRAVSGQQGTSVALTRDLRALVASNALDQRSASEIERLRRLRNNLLHGETSVGPQVIEDAGHAIERVLQGLATSPDAIMSEAAREALGRLGVAPAPVQP